MSMKIFSIALTGLILVVFGVVWLAEIFPGLKKIPNDYDQTLDFQGTYSIVANQEFLQELLGNASVQQIFQSPQALAVLGQPATQELLASSAFQSIMADPSVFRMVLDDPAAAAQALEPSMAAALAGPALQALLSEPAILQLLADPVAMGLMLDPRTAKLIAAPDLLEMVDIPINFHRVRTAEKTEGDILFIQQDFSASVLGLGQPLPQFSSTSTLAVHQKTRQYVEGGSEARRGGFAFPFDVKKDEVYPIWVSEVFQPLDASFVGTDNIEGLGVYTFRMQETGLPLPDEAKADIGLPATLDLIADVTMLTQTDPKSGITVLLESEINYRVNNQALGYPIIFRAEIRDSDESVLASVGDARQAKRQLFWLGVFFPWTALGIGIVLLAGSGVLLLRSRRLPGAVCAG